MTVKEQFICVDVLNVLSMFNLIVEEKHFYGCDKGTIVSLRNERLSSYLPIANYYPIALKTKILCQES